MKIKTAQGPSKSSPRLNKSEWLYKALNALEASGPNALNVQKLVDALGVSRGSFYWHFTDRNDFVHQLLDYWHDLHTAHVPDLIESKADSGEDEFLRFIHTILEKDLTRFDMPIRSWAMQDPVVAKLVHRTDRFRLEYTRGLFKRMGFSDSQAELRARSCVTYLIMGRRLLGESPQTLSAAIVEELHIFFCDKPVPM